MNPILIIFLVLTMFFILFELGDKNFISAGVSNSVLKRYFLNLFRTGFILRR